MCVEEGYKLPAVACVGVGREQFPFHDVDSCWPGEAAKGHPGHHAGEGDVGQGHRGEKRVAPEFKCFI